uniref:hypothetical protein n=1 Tax=Nitrospira cf. moscoviensis SBR1015 TaxID=96242 RepID=UPI0011213AEC|nr:hypothetical protein [Nitrospira cf. moscoviensis SBR1015]
MAFVMGAGIVDFRPGRSIISDRQPIAVVQAWGPTSELWWKLGLRYHPELATHHLKGGGQWSLAELVEGPPPAPEPAMTNEQIAEKVLEIVAETKPEFVQSIKNIRESGTEEQKAAARKRLESEMNRLGSEITGLEALTEYLED